MKHLLLKCCSGTKYSTKFPKETVNVKQGGGSNKSNECLKEKNEYNGVVVTIVTEIEATTAAESRVHHTKQEERTKVIKYLQSDRSAPTKCSTEFLNQFYKKEEEEEGKHTNCSTKVPFEPHMDKHARKEIHSSGFEHVSPTRKDTDSVDDEVKAKSHCITNRALFKDDGNGTLKKATQITTLVKESEKLPGDLDHVKSDNSEMFIKDYDCAGSGIDDVCEVVTNFESVLFDPLMFDTNNGDKEANFELKTHTSILISTSAKLTKEEAGPYKPKFGCTDHFAVYADLLGIKKSELLNRPVVDTSLHLNNNKSFTRLMFGDFMAFNYSVNEFASILLDPGGIFCLVRTRCTIWRNEILSEFEYRTGGIRHKSFDPGGLTVKYLSVKDQLEIKEII